MIRRRSILFVILAMFASLVPWSPGGISLASAVGTASITGTVFDANGVPIEGVQVTATLVGGVALDSVLTPSDGTFTFADLDAGDYRLSYEAAGYFPSTRGDGGNGGSPITVADGETGDGTVYLVGRSSVSGRVTTVEGDPQAGIEVTLSPYYGWPPVNLTATTTSDGSFRFDDLRGGQYVLGASLPRYLRASRWIAIGTGQQLTDADLVFQHGGSISGRVVLGDGTPIEGAVVTLPPAVMSGPGPGATTDADGRYEIAAAVGTFYIRIEAAGYSPAYIDVDGVPGRDAVTVDAQHSFTGQDVTLQRQGSISGVVTADGDPLAGVSVEATSIDDWSVPRVQVTTDDNGGYTIGADPGRYRLHFESPSTSYLSEWYDNIREAWSSAPVEVTQGQVVTGIDVELDRPATVSGHVVDQFGNALRDVAVNVHPYGPYVRTDRGGRYELTGLAPGAVDITVAAGEAYSTTSAVVEAGRNTLVDVMLIVRYSKLTGVVTDAGRPVAGATVRIEGLGVDETVSDSDGRYTFDGLATGYKAITVTAPGARESRSSVWVTDAVQTADITLIFPGTIRGTVTSNGVPVEHAFVVARQNEGWEQRYANSDADGSYTITDVAPGSYMVEFSAPGGELLASERYDDAHRLDDITPVVVRSLQDVDRIDADLEAAGSVEGAVVDQHGDPVFGAYITFSRPGFDDVSAWTSPYLARYSIAGLAEGSYTMTVTRYGVPPVSQSVTVIAGETVTRDITIVIEYGSIVVEAVDQEGDPVAGAYVSIGSSAYGTTGPDGRFVIDSILIGDHVVEIFSYGAATPREAQAVKVVAGQASVLRVVLDMYGTISGRVTDPTGAGVFSYITAYPLVAGADPITIYADYMGNYSAQLAAGRYALKVQPAWGSELSEEFYDNRTDLASATPIVVRGQETTDHIDVELGSAATISGTVTTRNGVGIAGVSVAVGPRGGPFVETTMTGVDGSFQIRGLAAGTHVLQFTRPGMATITLGDRGAPGPVTLTAGQSKSIAIVAPFSSGSVKGVVTNRAGRPVEGAIVTISGFSNTDMTTDAKGRYRVDGLLPGPYSVTASFIDHIDAQTTTAVTSGKTTTLNLALVARTRVGGQVIGPDGQPVADATVRLVRDVFAIFPPVTMTDADGRYGFVDVAPGTYTVSVSADGFVAHTSPRFVVVDGGSTTTDVQLAQAVTVSGRIVDGAGQPLSGAWVGAGMQAPATTDSDGFFVLTGLGSGPVTIRAGLTGYLTATTTVTLTSGDNQVGITLRQLGSVVGRVVDTNGNGLAGVAVTWNASPMIAPFAAVMTGPDGRYTITGVVGSGSIVAIRTGSPRQFLDADGQPGADLFVVGDGETLPVSDFVFDRLGSIAGIVTSAGGPVPGTTVSVQSLEGHGLTTGVTDADGGYRVERLSPGRYQVHFTSPTPTLASEYWPNTPMELPVTAVVVSADAAVTGIDALLDASTGLRGLVVDSDGRPMAGASVSAFGGIGPDRSASTTTGDDGRYDLGVMGWGDWVVQVSPAIASHWQSYQSPLLALSPGRPATHDVRLAMGGNLAMVTDAPSGFSLTIACPSPSIPELGGSVGAQCSGNASSSAARRVPSVVPQRALLAGLAPGNYNVAALAGANPAQLSTVAAAQIVANRDVTCSLSFTAASTCGGSAVRYKFSGFRSPVSNSKVNLVKYNQHVPLEWKLTDAAGHSVKDAASFVSVQATARPCGSGAKTRTLPVTHLATGFKALGSGRYRYVWEPGRARRGQCVTVTVTLADETTHSAEFKVR